MGPPGFPASCPALPMLQPPRHGLPAVGNHLAERQGGTAFPLSNARLRSCLSALPAGCDTAGLMLQHRLLSFAATTASLLQLLYSSLSCQSSLHAAGGSTGRPLLWSSVAVSTPVLQLLQSLDLACCLP